MTFFQFNTTAEAPSTSSQGLYGGASIGSMFGPVGAVVGGVAGGLLGMGSSGEQKRARRKATAASYSFVGDVYKYAGETRTQIGKEYERNLSTLTAVNASRGATSEEAFRTQKGKLIQERDTALSNLGLEIDEFRRGPNYEWFEKDLDFMTSAVSSGSGMRIRGVGRTGESIFTEEQRSRLIRFKPAGDRDDDRPGLVDAGRQLYREYSRMLRPSMAQYEQGIYGTAEEKRSFQASMNARITRANRWYNEQLAKEPKEDPSNLRGGAR